MFLSRHYNLSGQPLYSFIQRLPALISLIADTTLEGSPVVAATLSANATAVSPITASPLELVVTCCPVVVTVSTATPMVLPVGLALVVAPVVLDTSR